MTIYDFLDFLYFCLGVVARGDEVVIVAALLVEGAELDETVTHHIGVGRIARAYLFHRISGDLVPVLLMAVDNLEAAAVLMGDGRGHLQILL